MSGIGKYAELVFPDREKIPSVSLNWPSNLYRGSLNVKIGENGYPLGFEAPPQGVGVEKLDDGTFRPEFVIPGHLIGANKLLSEKDPRRGTAQVWRADLCVDKSTERRACWVVRRIGSKVGVGFPGNVLELVSVAYLRGELGLADGDEVSVIMKAGQPSGSIG